MQRNGGFVENGIYVNVTDVEFREVVLNGLNDKNKADCKDDADLDEFLMKFGKFWGKRFWV